MSKLDFPNIDYESDKESIEKKIIEGAEKQRRKQLPWEKDGLRKEIIKPFHLRFNEIDAIKADYLWRELGYKSKQEYLMSIVMEGINKDAEKVKKKEWMRQKHLEV